MFYVCIILYYLKRKCHIYIYSYLYYFYNNLREKIDSLFKICFSENILLIITDINLVYFLIYIYIK